MAKGRACLTCRPDHLANSEKLLACRKVRSNRYLGMQMVSIEQIKGSEGREKDFDRSFYPLVNHTRNRWMSVANAYRRNIALPPVEPIKFCDDYIVRDGHHRISVAQVMGQKYIEARVVEWKVA